ncbi:sigma-54-dependent Fis family transcriptional regulator [Bacillus sp. S/N-304-OC-R1]|uniref:sigma-54 interaction domain-containing protein n=1 Tax=Bacillus sp. S/N-304-OC-R1 TaxID=2758034 RepID=UPI001C8D2D6B|nr:sigma 54-interacting transcriptional regulator [Bacillus sp. S/N-304-OC-R1]MBY0121741.1 sigma 54-interacting transcriptional regulator [Bacillus sp. S/N-304-OC-R1]
MTAKDLPQFDEQLFLKILNALNDPIWIIDNKGNVLWVNQPTYDYFSSIQIHELVGQNVFEMEKRGVFSPSIARLVIEQKQAVSTTQITQNNLHMIISGDYIPDENGNIQYIVTHVRQLSQAINQSSELEKIESILQQYKQQIRQLLLQKNQQDDDFYVGKSKAAQYISVWSEKIADIDASILLTGETGVGKTAFAFRIHQLSNRNNKPFIHLDCGAIPESLIESELFGYKKGAFTGADANGKIGLIAAADQGTLFLDEIGEFPLHLQSKLLQFLQNKTYRMIGDNQVQQADVRIIAATNVDLMERVKEGTFRKDLFYRLNVLPLKIPPLRERKEDIIPLINYYLHRFNLKYSRQHTLSKNLMDALYNYRWEGNIRELENLMERLVITSAGPKIDMDDLPSDFPLQRSQQMLLQNVEEVSLPIYLEQIERSILINTYNETNSTWKTAKKLGVSQSYIIRRLKKFNLRISDAKELVEG